MLQFRIFNKSFILKILAFTFVLSFVACSNQKNTVTSRAFHNLTAHYNVYFNGNESFKVGEANIKRSFKDDYSLILPIFIYDEKNAIQPAVGDMDNTIKKMSKMIQFHSIKAKPKHKRGTKTAKQKAFETKAEYCKWIDDGYLFMGRSHLYRHEFDAAIQAFQFVIKTYPTEPIIYDAMLWTLRTYVSAGKFDDAREYLNEIRNTKDFPKKLEGQLALIVADYHIKEKRYKEAIPELEKAIEYEKKKKKRARLTYILAQLYQQIGDFTQSSELYAKVIKMHPEYEMEFNAQISRALVYNENQGDEELLKQMTKMLKDDKNYEYLDQIYYALANIDMKNGDKPAAIQKYKLSAQKSVNNDQQKGLSYLALAEIYYQTPVYDSAGLYYDSTMTFLSKKYENYAKVSAVAANLNDLIKNIKIVEREDSLQSLAKMGEVERNILIDKTIQDIKNAETRRQQEMQNDMRRGNDLRNELDPFGEQNSKGSWYFYNPMSVSRGQSEFVRMWGQVKLEDNWRRKNKSVIMEDTNVENAEDEAVNPDDDATNPLKRAYYLKDLPKTPEDFTASDDRIIDALLSIGVIYQERFKDTEASAKSYEELLSRFPKNKYLLTIYYNLYEMYSQIGDHTTADIYKRKIISEFPDSRYAKMFTNPNFLRELLAAQSQVSNLYQLAYTNFNNRNYAAVVNMVDGAMQQYPDNLLLPNFLFIKSMSEGAIYQPDKSKMLTGLKFIVEKYPNHEVGIKAKETITFLESEDKERQRLLDEESIYAVNPETPHYYVFVPIMASVDINKVKFDVMNFNIEKYASTDFTTEFADLNPTTKLLVNKQFKNKDEANIYFFNLKTDEFVKKYMDTHFTHFVITEGNFKRMIDSKMYEPYLRFYQKNY